MSNLRKLGELQDIIINCRLCPRLVNWRAKTAKIKVKRYMDENYWGKPVPGFGDPEARLLIVGLAPAANGGNRTGRMFTGDNSGSFLFSGLYKFGFSNKPTSVSKRDGLVVKDCYITALIRCVPPSNKPLKEEIINCHQYLRREFELLPNLKVVLTLGRIAFDEIVRMFYKSDKHIKSKKLSFGHGMVYRLNDSLTLIASYHPSQRNTFTNKLTESMFDSILQKVKNHLDKG